MLDCNILHAQASQCLLHSLPYHIMTSLRLQGLPFHTPVYNTLLHVCRWLYDEIAELGGAGGERSEPPPPACKI